MMAQPLRCFLDIYRSIGIDPTAKKFSKYYTDNIKLVPDFFNSEIALKATNGDKAKLDYLILNVLRFGGPASSFQRMFLQCLLMMEYG